ncbi:IS4 family transposase [Bradyrhizobium sp.]|uniref:IS4 family transposase n=1 Tax=Bradyrhizobium sp. TaxID=376 RepID=UPI0026137E8D|nr:IS4 family transposase [Bradyrhizobium sp.]
MHDALVRRPGSCIRRLAGNRAREIQFTRFLRNERVSVAEMASHAAARTANRVAGREIIVVQDTSELFLGGRRAKANGYGPVGKGGGVRGLLLHAALAIDAGNDALLGLVDAQVWNRDKGKVTARRSRVTASKESQRWLSASAKAGKALSAARSITVISDRESDIYEHFARRPANVEFIVRASWDRQIKLESGKSARLFAFGTRLPEASQFSVTIPAAPGRKKRTAQLVLRFSPVTICRPHPSPGPGLPDTIGLTLVDVREVSSSHGGKPIHWRLLTTHVLTSPDQARRIVDLYRKRWTIEEYFRTLKTAGFDIEAADIGDPEVMIKFVAAAAVAAVTIMQLVRSRDGATQEELADALEPDDGPVLEALSIHLEGTTAKQKNPHAKGTLAFAAWVIARLGGWTAYYGKPGPMVMRIGFEAFRRIKYGTTLKLQNV